MFHKKRKSGLQDNTDEENSVNREESEITEDKPDYEKKNRGRTAGKTAVVLAVLAAAAAAGFLIYSSVSGSEGSRKSQKLAKKIGEPTEKAVSFARVDLTTSSDFSFLNEICDFTSVAESERTTKVYDVRVPEWTVFCSEDSFGKLESVTYYDFRVLKSSINGVKKKNKIDTSDITSGCTLAEVNTVLGMNPYQVVYSGKSVSRKYKYYYRDKQTDDIRAYYITVMFGSDNTVNAPAIVEENNFIYDILKADNN